MLAPCILRAVSIALMDLWLPRCIDQIEVFCMQAIQKIAPVAAPMALTIPLTCFGQDRERESDGNRDRMPRIEAGITIPVRIDESIDVELQDNRVYTGVVDREIRGD